MPGKRFHFPIQTVFPYMTWDTHLVLTIFRLVAGLMVANRAIRDKEYKGRSFVAWKIDSLSINLMETRVRLRLNLNRLDDESVTIYHTIDSIPPPVRG